MFFSFQRFTHNAFTRQILSASRLSSSTNKPASRSKGEGHHDNLIIFYPEQTRYHRIRCYCSCCHLPLHHIIIIINDHTIITIMGVQTNDGRYTTILQCMGACLPIRDVHNSHTSAFRTMLVTRQLINADYPPGALEFYPLGEIATILWEALAKLTLDSGGLIRLRMQIHRRSSSY